MFQEKVAVDSADFDSLIARATKETCGTIFAVMPAPALVKFIKSARAKKYRGKILVRDTLSTNDMVTLGPDAEGIYMAQVWSDDANLKSRYSTKYKNAPDNVTLGFSAVGYDTVKCLLDINKPLDAASTRYSFLSTPCEGLTGKTQFTGERMAQRRRRILTVNKGELVLGE